MGVKDGVNQRIEGMNEKWVLGGKIQERMVLHGFGKLAYICMGNDAQTMKNKKCDSADCKVAEK